jgi:hypothetical protein
VGYLSAAIRDDYRSMPGLRASAAQTPAPGAATGTRRAQARRLSAQDRLAALRKTHRSVCFDVVEALAGSRSPALAEADRAAFLAGLDTEADREDFRRRGWRSALNGRAIFRFWEAIQPGALPPIEDIAAAQGQDWRALCNEANGPASSDAD